MSADFDLLVIGGGINGAGIANLAAQSGLVVLLVEQDDLAAHTSSQSSKLIHGGLRYLEFGELRLVREALAEREVLLAMAPHLVRPLTFVLPVGALSRPAWMIGAGLFVYDHLGRRKTLAKCRRLNLRRDPLGRNLAPGLNAGFSYSDCAVDDARLVVLNAMQAEEYGASILPRTRLLGAERQQGGWQARIRRADGSERSLSARALVNATGPWAARLGAELQPGAPPVALRLVKGSHIVVPRLYQGDQAYILQQDDRRVVFALPYGEFNLIGTTDVPYEGEPGEVCASAGEIEYLCRAVNAYFCQQTSPRDVVWHYAGVRPLFDDGASEARAVTRDYQLQLQAPLDGAPLLSVLGGKLTTYRQLALAALARLAPYFPEALPAADPPLALPGGTLPLPDLSRYQIDLARRFPFVPPTTLAAMIRRHGARCEMLLRGVARLQDLGRDFGGGLYLREVEWLCAEEWAAQPDDVLWRRTKCGLAMTAAQKQDFAAWWQERSAADDRHGALQGQQ
jgi:glycerol-3-phosphate dehydrogenase